MPTSARRAPQLSGRHSLTDQFENVGVSRRSGSPSDALLNVRGAIKCKHSEAPARNFEQTNSSKSHKRAASAPDISRLIDLEASQDPYAEVPSPSEVMVVAKQFNLQNLGRASHASLGMISTSSDAFAARAVPTEDDDGVQALPAPRHVRDSSPSTPHFHHDQKIVRQSSSLGEDEGETPVCMFVDDCDTGSQLRKAISHLFGRNKTCTLKIPKMVWVYYCRKHYQRVRYRNARTYPVTQMELVEAQIERLKAWSDENQARGKGAYIKSWTLSLRKREEKRLRGSKRAAEDEDDAAAAAAAAGPGPSSHIPSWILDELGAGFDTARMFSIADRLRQEIESGTLSQVPEIEFLPDIVDDDGERDSGKPARHRWQNGAAGAAKTPKRKAHEFAAATGRGAAPYQQAAVPWASHHGSDEVAGEPSPSGKRPRTARAATFPQHQPSPDLGGASAYIDGLPLHAYMAPGPCCGPSDPSGGPGGAHHGPPRALNVVPRMQPLEHHSLTVHPHHEPAAGRGEAFPNVDGAAGHARTASHQGAREAGSGPGAYAHHQVSGYSHQQQHLQQNHQQQQPPPLPASRNSLPSIATQMQSGRVSGYSHVDAPPYGQGPPRLTHHRSASAYTPGSRLLSSTHGRPSASASAVPAADPRLPRQAATTRGGHALLPPPRDDAQHHRGPAYGEDARRRGQHDDGRQRCGPGWCTHLPRHYEHGVVPGGPDGAGGNPRAW
ncbi:hypothetical protein UVI_02059930 [Ustilaginoidea virens]|uniref:ORP1 like protein n=1 Tax=Ustilaginoidea virens TaxID=1159556 RepID=A0A1B5L676_USTVR|nr:hypothetical protein UVI_02059930 [Ustilaginoidea virens]